MNRSFFYRPAIILLCLLLLACQGGHDDDDAPTDDDATDDDTTDDDLDDDDDLPSVGVGDRPPVITWRYCAEFFDPLTAAFLPDDVACGTVAAPWDYDDPAGGEVAVRFALVASTSAAPAGTLAVHLGGPDPNLRNLVLFKLQPKGILAREFRGQFEMLFVEARGSATSSTPLVCPDEMFGEPYAGEAQYRELVRLCLAALPAAYRLDHMSTLDSVRDLELVRRALKIEKLRLFGNSYGSRYMLEYLRQYEDHVSAYLLDSVLPPQADARHELDQVLWTLAGDCAADEDCPVEADRILALTDTALARLDDNPLAYGLDGYRLTDDLFHMGDRPGHLARWPRVLAKLTAGRTRSLQLWDMAARELAPPRHDLPTNGETFEFDPYRTNVMCADFPGWNDVTDRKFVLRRLSPPYIPLPQLEWMSHVACEELAAYWAAEPAVMRDPVESAVPGLLVTPRLDEDTPWTDATQAMEEGLAGANLLPVNLDHRVLIDLGSFHQGLARSDQECLRKLAVDWLISPFDPYERACVADLTAPLSFE